MPFWRIGANPDVVFYGMGTHFVPGELSILLFYYCERSELLKREKQRKREERKREREKEREREKSRERLLIELMLLWLLYKLWCCIAELAFP
jgi:hypothetical protein